MSQDASTISDLRAAFEKAGQAQVFRFWDELDEAGQKRLAESAASIDLEEISTLARQDHGADDGSLGSIEPAPVIPFPENGGDADAWESAELIGVEALQAGRVAAFTVAGGQGTRLGFDGPKGTYPVTPVQGHSLFQVFAEKVLAASRRYRADIPWYIMTSVINHEDTVSFFEANGYFGLEPSRVHFFQQGLMPAIDDEGRILLAAKDVIAMSPDGHGGSLRALVRSGSIQRMAQEGIDIISYFQVDNPLTRILDPVFIGHHVAAGSELSAKALPKVNAAEKVGVFCQVDGTVSVVEYSDLPLDLMEKTDSDGNLVFSAGSIAIHLFDRDFVARLGDPECDVELPFHRARKKIPHVDENGDPVSPVQPNGTKFEMFVFDALPFARNPVIVETAREDDFSPVKNAEGADSVVTSKADQQRQFARWFAEAGVPLATDDTGLPQSPVEISPLFADSVASFIEAWEVLGDQPSLDGPIVL